MASVLTFDQALALALKKGEITEKIAALMGEFYRSYKASLAAHGIDMAPFAVYFFTYFRSGEGTAQKSFRLSTFPSPCSPPC